MTREGSDAAARRRPDAATDGFVVRLDAYNGPLALLLHLVRSKDVDILDIPVAEIAEQFLSAVRERGFELDAAGEFLETAAMLLRIKAEMLLPGAAEELDYEDPRADLVRRLLRYEQICIVAEELRRAEAERALSTGRGAVAAPGAPEPPPRELEVDWDETMRAARQLAPPKKFGRPPSRLVTASEKMDIVVGRLAGRDRLRFSALLEGFSGRMHVPATLLACLELVRNRLLVMRQERNFATLWLYRPRSAPEPRSR